MTGGGQPAGEMYMIGDKVRADKSVQMMNVGINFLKPHNKFPTQLSITSTDERDIRVFELNFRITPKPSFSILQIKCPVNQELEQEIPVENRNEKDIDLTIEVDDDMENSAWFDIPRKWKMRKDNKLSGFPIIFKPLWMAKAFAKLTIKIPTLSGTDVIFNYDLVGVGTQPLSEDHILIKCNVNEEKSHTISIKEKPVKFSVMMGADSDIPNISGPDSITLEPD